MRAKTRRRLDALYAELPRLECQGKCVESCGPIVMSRVEWERLRDATPRADEPMRNLTCPLLKDGRCTVYEIRPMICRLWGAVEVMPCPWGCKPTRYLTKVEGFGFLRRSRVIGA